MTQLCGVVLRHRTKRKSQPAGIPAEHLHGGFYRDGVYLVKKRIKKTGVGLVDGAGGEKVAAERCGAERCQDLRNNVRCYRDDALCSEREHGERLVVISAPDVQRIAAEMPGAGDKGNVTGGFLYAVDARYLRQTRVVLRSTGYAGPAGDVVNDERQLGMLRDVGKVPDDPLGVCFVVVRRCKQKRVRPDPFGAPRGVCRGERVVPTDPGDDFHAGTGVNRGELDNGSAFRLRKRRGLAGRAAHDNGGGAAFGLPVERCGKTVVVYAPVGEWGNKRSCAAGENRFFHVPSFLPVRAARRAAGKGTAKNTPVPLYAAGRAAVSGSSALLRLQRERNMYIMF